MNDAEVGDVLKCISSCRSVLVFDLLKENRRVFTPPATVFGTAVALLIDRADELLTFTRGVCFSYTALVFSAACSF
jgi:hypothetical protein